MRRPPPQAASEDLGDVSTWLDVAYRPPPPERRGWPPADRSGRLWALVGERPGTLRVLEVAPAEALPPGTSAWSRDGDPAWTRLPSATPGDPTEASAGRPEAAIQGSLFAGPGPAAEGPPPPP